MVGVGVDVVGVLDTEAVEAGPRERREVLHELGSGHRPGRGPPVAGAVRHAPQGVGPDLDGSGRRGDGTTHEQGTRHPRSPLGNHGGEELDTARGVLPAADGLTEMAVPHLRDDDYRAIEKLSGEAVVIYDRHGSVPDDNYALSLNMHGLGLRYVGRLEEAERELQRTIVVQELRRRASPDLDVVRSRFYRLGAYGDLATVQLLKGDSLAAWNTQERGLSRRWLERAFARGELDTAGAWDHLLARLQAKLTDSSAVIGWPDAVY